MARYIVTENISAKSDKNDGEAACFERCLKRLKSFDLEGYHFIAGGESTDECLVFDRSGPPPTATATKPRAKKIPADAAADTDATTETKLTTTATKTRVKKIPAAADVNAEPILTTIVSKSRVKKIPAIAEPKILPEKKKAKR